MNIGGFSGSIASSGLRSAAQGVNESSERIASGLRINAAKDDAAGFAIANRADSQISGINQSIRNANDGVSMLQTADASLGNMSEGIFRLQELAVQAGNGLLNPSDREAINKEAQQLLEGIAQEVSGTSFNGRALFDGAETTLQTVANTGDTHDVSLDNLAQQLEESGFNTLDFSTAEGASAALDVLQQVQTDMGDMSANIGANMNRLESTMNSLNDAAIATTESQSRIRDADMAKEISEQASNQVKLDVAIAMQAQANQQRGSVLQLLQ